MRRSSSTTRRCGASSASGLRAWIIRSLFCARPSARTVLRLAIGARNQRLDISTRRRLDHGGEKLARRFAGVAVALVEGAGETPRLQERELERERLAFRRDEEEPLTPVGGPGALDDVAVVDEFAQHAAEALLGDFQDIEQIGDPDAGMAVDEMQHPVVRAAEIEARQHLVGVADEVAIGEKQKLDQIEGGTLGLAGGGRSEPDSTGREESVETFMSAILTYSGSIVTRERVLAKGSVAEALNFQADHCTGRWDTLSS